MESESVIAATFSKFGVRFCGGECPNLSVRTNEDFFIYAVKNMFFDGRTAKAVTSWATVYFDSLDQDKVFNLIMAEDKRTQAIVAALLSMLQKDGERFKKLFKTEPLTERFAPLGEFGDLGNEWFGRYNISAPGLSPEPVKYIKKAA